jgi:hypothetical protein
MTGKTQKVTAVVEELMDIHARDERRRPLLSADEIDCEQEQKAAKDRPRQKVADRNRNRADAGRKSDIGHDLNLPG